MFDHCLIAFLTMVRLLSRVNPRVNFQFVFSGQNLAADVTIETLHRTVALFLMFSQVPFGRKQLETDAALELDICVEVSLVLGECICILVFFEAGVALKVLSLSVKISVLHQVVQTCKGLGTSHPKCHES